MKSEQFPGVELYGDESETWAEWLYVLRGMFGAILLGVAICAVLVLIVSWLS